MSERRNESDGFGDERVPYASYAFGNVYNYATLGGLAAAALLTQSWWLLILAGGVEALWMMFAPDSRLLRRLWFDKAHAARLEEVANRALESKIAELPDTDATRVRRLMTKRFQVIALAGENRALGADLMKSELGKLEALVHSFADLSTAASRHSTYLATVDWRALEADIRRHQSATERDEGEPREIAQKNLSLLTRRKEKLTELKSFVAKARGQMDLIENTFQLLADQIVTMRSPQELDGQLDELIDGVEAVRSTARETDALLEAVAH